MTLGACARQQEKCRKERSRTLRRSLLKTRKERQISCALYVHRPLRPFDEPGLNCIIFSLYPQAIGEDRLSYRDLLYRIAYLKREFESLGVVQDDNVLITIAPSADFFAAILAVFSIGINTYTSKSEGFKVREFRKNNLVPVVGGVGKEKKFFL